jgi:large subunit ribosomal protein L2
MLVKVKPTLPDGARSSRSSRRAAQGQAVAALVESESKNAGRNTHGRITMRHKGGGHKQHYRIVDFKRNKDGIAAKVERIEYDPNRSAHLALLLYADGERRYVIAQKGVARAAAHVRVGGADQDGNTLPLRNIPVGTTICCVEMMPARARRSRARPARRCSSSRAKANTRSCGCARARIRRVHINCRATIGEVGNEEHSLESIGKAGRVRWRGVRPTCAASR